MCAFPFFPYWGWLFLHSEVGGACYMAAFEPAFMDPLFPYSPHQFHNFIYFSLARQLAHVRTLVIAKMDVTQNTIADPQQQFQVTGYPTIYLKITGPKGRILEYTGLRTITHLKAFLLEHLPHPFNPSDVRDPAYDYQLDELQEADDDYVTRDDLAQCVMKDDHRGDMDALKQRVSGLEEVMDHMPSPPGMRWTASCRGPAAAE